MKVINDWLRQPEAYDSEFWQYLEFNINELAFHTHDGDAGDKLPPTSLLQNSDNTVSPTTLDSGTGLYYADVTLPTDYKFDDTTISFFDGNDRVYLDYSKIDDDNYRVISAYNTKTYGVRYA